MRPLLMIHGIMSNARNTFGTPGRVFQQPKTGGMFNFLIGQGYQPGQTLFWFSYPSLQPVLASARRLQQEIVNVKKVTGCREVDILSFSLGGIVAKYFAVSPLYHGEIAKMIMIAPPFLGTAKADLYKTNFSKGKSDLLFTGDSRAFTPQILGYNHHLLLEMAQRPFPSGIHTAIIAIKIAIGANNDLRSLYHRFIASWIGEGDQTVPVESTNIAVNRRYIVEDSYAPGKVHGFLPSHAEVQKLVIKELRDEGL